MKKNIAPPDWKGEVEKIIRNKYPDNFTRAVDLISRPEATEAKKILDNAWKRRKKVRDPYPSPLFAEAVMLCAFYGELRTAMELPFWMTDRKEAARLAKNARELVKVTGEFVKLRGGPDSGVSFTVELDKIFLELEPLADKPPYLVTNAKILAVVRFLAGYLTMIAEAPRKEGAPENLSKRNLLCGLEDRFRADIGKPLYNVIALLWQAVSGKDQTDKGVKTTLDRYRKR